MAAWIAGVDAEVPMASIPIQRTEEIGGSTEGSPLPVEQDVAHVKVAALPVGAEHIVATGHTHKIIKVYLVCSLILLVGEVKLVCHLVREEKSLVACLLVAHSFCRCYYREYCQ